MDITATQNLLHDLCRGDKKLAAIPTIKTIVKHRLTNEYLLSPIQIKLLAARYAENKSIYEIANYAQADTTVIEAAINRTLDVIRTNKETYSAMKARQLIAFGETDSRGYTLVKWAFSQKQFDKIAAEWDYRIDLSKDEICRVENVSGMFCLKSNLETIRSMLETHKCEMLLATKCNDFLCDALCCELKDRKYTETGDTFDACAACGITTDYIENEHGGESRVNISLGRAKTRCLENVYYAGDAQS